MTIARPYPETVEALEARIRDLEARIDGLVRERATHLERIAALEAENARWRPVTLCVSTATTRHDDLPLTFAHDPNGLPPTRAETEATRAIIAPVREDLD